MKLIKKRDIDEHFCGGNTLPRLIKQEKSELVFRVIYEKSGCDFLVLYEVIVCCHHKSVQLCLFWESFKQASYIHIYIYMYILRERERKEIYRQAGRQTDRQTQKLPNS